ADDLHKVAFTKLAGDCAENARATRIVFGIDQHDRIRVELHVRPVLATGRALGADDDSPHHGLLLQFAAGDNRLDAADDDVTQARRAALAAAEDLDAHHFASARVIGDRHAGFLLNHDEPSLLGCFAGAFDLGDFRTGLLRLDDHALQDPPLQLRQRRRL